MTLTRLYDDRARLYDKIYDWKDYASEARTVRKLLKNSGVADGSRVLEAACGTGNYLGQLTRWYEMSGFDRSPKMLDLAAEKEPELPIFLADMVDFQVEQPFDALLCLFSSIGYLFPAERYQRALERFFEALKPGGIVIVEPWLTPDRFVPNRPSMQTYQDEEFKICRQCVSQRNGATSEHHFNWLVAGSGGIDYFVDIHVLGLYTTERQLGMFRAAGFAVRYLAQGLMPQRGLFIARRPS